MLSAGRVARQRVPPLQRPGKSAVAGLLQMRLSSAYSLECSFPAKESPLPAKECWLPSKESRFPAKESPPPSKESRPPA